MSNLIPQNQLLLFKNVITELHPLPDSDFALLTNVLKQKQYKKGEVILQEGNICKHLWFICKGCVRLYCIENGVEMNMKFFFEGKIASDFISLRHTTPSNFFLVAMEDTEVLIAYKPEYKPVMNFSKSIIMLSSRFFQQSFFNEMQHSNSFKLLNPEQRYRYLEDNHPKYLQRIPLTYLASYLGMSRKTLGRIRSNTL